VSDRVRCVVPFCGRTTKPGDFNEWICAKHWPNVDRRTKWLHRAIKRKARRFGWTDELAGMAARVWIKAKRQAIERQ
jgi:hypothetical protein